MVVALHSDVWRTSVQKIQKMQNVHTQITEASLNLTNPPHTLQPPFQPTRQTYLEHVLPDQSSKTTYAEHLAALLNLNSVVWKRFVPEYVKQIFRLLPILATKNPIETFQTCTEDLTWCPKTALSYWGTILRARSLLNLPDQKEYAAMTVILTRRANTAPAWDPLDEQQILSDSDIEKIRTAATTTPPQSPMQAVMVTINMGQRIGDILNLTTDSVMMVNEMIALTFLISKTADKIGVFTIHIPMATETATFIWNAAIAAPSHGKLFPTSEEDTKKILQAFVGHKVDLRALRRTGLTRLAMVANLDVVLSLSHHSSIHMLETYLGQGRFNFCLAKSQGNALTMVEQPGLRMPQISIPASTALFQDTTALQNNAPQESN